MSVVDLTNCRSVIFGCEGTTLSAAEKKFFKAEQPVGFILFSRNVETPKQLKKLVKSLRTAVGRPDAPVLIDQEGGRVQRLRAPHWFEAKSFGHFGDLYQTDPERAIEALRLTARLIAADLREAGITVNCTPCLDLHLPETVDAIGNRAFADNPQVVARLGAVVAEEMLTAGIIPVVKHMPGHGRATIDSHHALPHVGAPHDTLQETDFAPFKTLSVLPWGMTSHIVFDAIDPDHPATQSAAIIKDVIRGEIGFSGLLLTDDLNMEALSGSLAERATAALEAGVDIVLHCSGVLTEMQELAAVCPPLTEEAQARIELGNRVFDHTPDKIDAKADLARLNDLLETDIA
ncbi:beta-N-acetylhexosaminidase [Sneathiella sp. CAU 1612]|uniref:beta-N-acetylhexosaminidase n=1 Tax=Sneathiella sedimenti TaxID=2816034 RepID=A0ABS3F9L5_9PROT|nr:beta-N-acetylhexosaminidase [Sneathiella sedimenti]MBO0334632.1 beta-N-acetylhexosaminidase [Sneathiella sedimenti]